MKKYFLIIATVFCFEKMAAQQIMVGKTPVDVKGNLESSVKIIPEILEAGDTRKKADYYVAYEEKFFITEIVFGKYNDTVITQYYFNTAVTKPAAKLAPYKSKIFPGGIAYTVTLSCKIDCMYQDMYDAYTNGASSRTTGFVQLLFDAKPKAEAFIKKYNAFIKR